MASVLEWAEILAVRDINKPLRNKALKIKATPKLEDANCANRKEGYKCTLIITEGDSAKSLAISGLSVIGRDYYGVFPLRGKLLNVRDHSLKHLLKNAEAKNLMNILGLELKKKYHTMEDMRKLRYGKVMIMADQDEDGSHIKGLIINFFHNYWPSLLRHDYLQQFITPIVKAIRNKEEISFYTLAEFEEWQRRTPNHNKYHQKYYKGLGTSTSKEAKEYFSNMERHCLTFKYNGSVDDECLNLAFSKKKIFARKNWLLRSMQEKKTRTEQSIGEINLYRVGVQEITLHDFIHYEFVNFSVSVVRRSIPNVIDGFKPSQRKVLYTCLRRNDKRDVKVAQLAGAVAELCAYHHGEDKLSQIIVYLAQNFIGSNNINLLEPRGQFGTRLENGKDWAQPRYIFTKMSPITRLIFHPADDPILTYGFDDGHKIEPKWYVPIIPIVLVNGADGIATGWNTKIPNYNPRDIIQNIRRMLKDEQPLKMTPWYKNFRGEISHVTNGRYVCCGNIQILANNRIEITELPVGKATQAYKEQVLDSLTKSSDREDAIITDYQEYNTDTTVRFIVALKADVFRELCGKQNGFHEMFKLFAVISTTQMNAFNENDVLCHYDTDVQILQTFYKVRLEYYDLRKQYIVSKLKAEAARLKAQHRFIVQKCEGIIKLDGMSRQQLIIELTKLNYGADPVQIWKESQEFKAEKQVETKIENEQTDENGDDEMQNDGSENDESENDESENDESENDGSENDESENDEEKDANDDKETKKKNHMLQCKKYDYLLGMPLWMLTEERTNHLRSQYLAKSYELERMKKTSNKNMWEADLRELEVKLNMLEAKEIEDACEKQKNYKIKKWHAIKKKEKLKKATMQLDQSQPDTNGAKVEFKLTLEFMAKINNSVLMIQKTQQRKMEELRNDSCFQMGNGEFLTSQIQDQQTADKLHKQNRKRKHITRNEAKGCAQNKRLKISSSNSNHEDESEMGRESEAESDEVSESSDDDSNEVDSN